MSWIITGSEKNSVDLYRSNVSLLLHGDGANGSTTIVDSSPSPKTVTAFGDAQISTAIADRFGNSTGVLAFDGNGDYATVPYNSDLQIGSAFTVEFFLYLRANSTASFGQVLLSCRNSGVSNGWSLAHYLGNYALIVGGSDSGLVGSTVLNTWQHIAATYDGTNARLFVEGLIVATFAVIPVDNTNPLVICNEPTFDNNRSTNCLMDEIRITKGVARYTANFTPPTAPFPDF